MKEAELEEDEDMCKVIASFRYCRCNYKKYDNQEYFLYESLCAHLSYSAAKILFFQSKYVVQ